MSDRRRKLIKALRPVVLLRDSFRCVYCGLADEMMLVLDHVVPRSRGGRDTIENLVAACSDCNSRKGTRTLAELGWEVRR